MAAGGDPLTRSIRSERYPPTSGQQIQSDREPLAQRRIQNNGGEDATAWAISQNNKEPKKMGQ